MTDKYLYTKFLKDENEYKLAEQYWQNMCSDLIPEAELNNWRFWLNTRYADGTPFMDGNPIYSLENKINNKAIKIIQEEPDETVPHITAWIDKFDSSQGGENNELVVLCIHCCLTQKTGLLAEKLIQLWVSEKSDQETMDESIADLLDEPDRQA